MMIYDELKKDHRDVLALCDRLIQSADASADQRNSLITQIRDALIPHSRAEEAVFYNAIRQENDSKSLIGHAYTEHMMAEGLLRSMQVAGKVDIGWRQTATKLRDALAITFKKKKLRFSLKLRKFSRLKKRSKSGPHLFS